MSALFSDWYLQVNSIQASHPTDVQNPVTGSERLLGSHLNTQHKKTVITMLTYPWKCTVLHCNHLGNTWKPLVLMTQHFDYCPSASEGDNQTVRSSAPVVSRCFPGGYNVKLYISRGRLAWWLLAFLHSDNSFKYQLDRCHMVGWHSFVVSNVSIKYLNAVISVHLQFSVLAPCMLLLILNYDGIRTVIAIPTILSNSGNWKLRVSCTRHFGNISTWRYVTLHLHISLLEDRHWAKKTLSIS